MICKSWAIIISHFLVVLLFCLDFLSKRFHYFHHSFCLGSKILWGGVANRKALGRVTLMANAHGRISHIFTQLSSCLIGILGNISGISIGHSELSLTSESDGHSSVPNSGQCLVSWRTALYLLVIVARIQSLGRPKEKTFPIQIILAQKWSFAIAVVFSSSLSFLKWQLHFETFPLQRFKHSVSCGFTDSQCKGFYGTLSSVEYLFRSEHSLVKLETLGLESGQQQLELCCRRDF